MNKHQRLALWLIAASLCVFAPYILPNYQNQLVMLWLMVTLSLTWDIMGGQMGYNSFGNIVYFGIGMYVCAVIQRDLFFDVDSYESVAAGVNAVLSGSDYLLGLSLGVVAAAVVCLLTAILFGAFILGLRGHYFAICTLGMGIAMGQIAGGIDYIGAGSGMVAPLLPEELGSRGQFFYFYFLILAVATFFSLRFVYSRRFGLAINAIRDDEDKAEAMGLNTTRYKITAWAIAALFLAIAGAGYGNFMGFIDPEDIAFSGSTLGVWMVLMAILGGKGTMWGPVLGAFVFHICQEVFWTYLFGWQRVALGLLIVLIVVFFPTGILGVLRERRIKTTEPEKAAKS